MQHLYVCILLIVHTCHRQRTNARQLERSTMQRRPQVTIGRSRASWRSRQARMARGILFVGRVSLKNMTLTSLRRTSVAPRNFWRLSRNSPNPNPNPSPRILPVMCTRLTLWEMLSQQSSLQLQKHLKHWWWRTPTRGNSRRHTCAGTMPLMHLIY